MILNAISVAQWWKHRTHYLQSAPPVVIQCPESGQQQPLSSTALDFTQQEDNETI